MNEKILIVDDESTVCDVVGRYLRVEGFEPLVAGNGEEALRLASDVDLVILDLMLPKLDGFEVCRRLRATRDTPIIMLSAKKKQTDKISALRLGADDYVVKPFSPGELVERVRAVLRRTTACPQIDGIIRIGDLRINPHTRVAQRGDTVFELTAHEFDLLAFLACHPMQVFTRAQLLDQVWDYVSPNGESTVTATICRLRDKIEVDSMRPLHVKTVWGIGYKLAG